MSKPTNYNNVIFRGQYGKIRLTDTTIVFKFENWQNQEEKSYRYNRWRWSAIAKHQVNSKASEKALLKLVSKADSSKCAIFQLENHEILAKLRDDVTQRMRNAKELSRRVSMNRDTSSVVKDRFQSRRPSDALNWVHLRSIESIDVALAKVQGAHQDETKNCVAYMLEGKSFLVHYRTLLKSISDLLLTTSQSRKWICISIRFSLTFPFEELEEHRERFDIIKSGYEELKSRVMRPLGHVERVSRCRYRYSSPDRDNDTCSETGEFTMEIPKEVDTETLNLGDLAPEDAIVQLEEVRTNENLTRIGVGMDLISSKEFMDCLADIMSDYFPQKRFKCVSFRWSHGHWENAKILVDEWIGCVANRIGVEPKTLCHSASSGWSPLQWNEDFTETIPGSTGSAVFSYRFDGGRPGPVM